MFEPAHKSDFDNVYNLPTPHHYYRGLKPTGYRMPEVIATLLHTLAPRLAEAGVTDGNLRVVDFASGYGAVGAMLRHQLSMTALLSFFEDDEDDTGANERARQWFDAHRIAAPGIHLTGLDIAPRALAYAMQLGFVDAVFSENLVADIPSPDLRDVLRGAHLVVESGGVGEVQSAVFDRILTAGARPWLLRSPRPDVDWRPFEAMLARHEYVEEPVGPRVRYRRCLGQAERDEVVRLSAQFGVNAEDLFCEGYIAVQMTVARPQSVAARWPLPALLGTRLDALR